MNVSMFLPVTLHHKLKREPYHSQASWQSALTFHLEELNLYSKHLPNSSRSCFRTWGSDTMVTPGSHPAFSLWHSLLTKNTHVSLPPVRVRLAALPTGKTAVYKAGTKKQAYVFRCLCRMCVCMCSCSVMSNSLQPHGL